MLPENKQKKDSNYILHIMVSFTFLIGLFSAHYVLGQVMTSGSYKMQSDSLNFGGNFSTSSSYNLQDTAGEIATGISSSTNFKIKAGYQQIPGIILSVVPAPGNVSMSPSIGGITGGTSNGSTTFTVTTDNPAGYTVSIEASGSPAMQSPLDTIADYVPSGGNPDFAFSILSSQSAFGFTVEGTDTAQNFKDDGTSCNTGSGNIEDACWVGLSTSPQTIVNRTSGNLPSGTETIVKFRAESGSSHVQVNGTYVATTTITVLPL